MAYVIAGLLIVLVLAVLAGGNLALRKRVERRDGTLKDAMSDNTDPVPGTHLAVDSETDLGDTSEAHDTITAHDLPLSHPGRAEAERQTDGHAGTTSGTPGGAG